MGAGRAAGGGENRQWHLAQLGYITHRAIDNNTVNLLQHRAAVQNTAPDRAIVKIFGINDKHFTGA